MTRLLPMLLVSLSVPTLAAAQSAEDNVRAAIGRVERLNPRIGAVLALDPTARDQARALDRGRRGRGILFGMPILLKDNIEAAGPLPTTAGSLALIDNVTNRDAPVTASLRAAGAVILGKTNLSEWANIRSNASISGWSAVGGQTRNPHALDRNPCGSSSGSGAAVAAGMVDAAIGTETDGSITCPAAINGIVGLKPTVGLVSRTRIVPISHSQDTPGPMTRDVATAARVLTAIAGSDPADAATAQADRRRTNYTAALNPAALKGMRIGVLRFATGWSAPVDRLFDAALAVLRAQGATLVDIATLKDRDKIGPAENLVLMTELKADLNAYLATTPPAVKTRTLADVIAFNTAHADQEMALFGQESFLEAQKTKGLTDPAYLAARALSLRIAGRDGIDALLAGNRVTALVAPTMPPAWLIDTVNGDQISGGGAGGLAAVSGYPHLTVPMGAVRGMPVGLSFIGPAWSEARLIGYGYAYEQASRLKLTPSFRESVERDEETEKQLRPAKR
ncbi:amidase [Sphingomonas prati]|uniref:Amidase n=1 Tax=Sphingomonas prati TaxID=1843237 RepID=A0A7W9F1F8_9SPHN|nr:amidase [Sphingomonas prati]MBB5727729.1 amidase [Sphingomonas prati]GGE80293.1 amidase [Sphingomonas prati]